MSKRIVVGISGASGVIYGARMLEVLKNTDYETHLIISESGKLNFEIETQYKAAEIESMADRVWDHKNMAASLASGSFITEGMVVVPCTIKTLSGIANSYNENLIVRAADVTLKENKDGTLVAEIVRPGGEREIVFRRPPAESLTPWKNCATIAPALSCELK